MKVKMKWRAFLNLKNKRYFRGGLNTERYGESSLSNADGLYILWSGCYSPDMRAFYDSASEGLPKCAVSIPHGVYFIRIYLEL